MAICLGSLIFARLSKGGISLYNHHKFVLSPSTLNFELSSILQYYLYPYKQVRSRPGGVSNSHRFSKRRMLSQSKIRYPPESRISSHHWASKCITKVHTIIESLSSLYQTSIVLRFSNCHLVRHNRQISRIAGLRYVDGSLQILLFMPMFLIINPDIRNRHYGSRCYCSRRWEALHSKYTVLFRSLLLSQHDF